jgi:hypothetical protein
VQHGKPGAVRRRLQRSEARKDRKQHGEEHANQRVASQPCFVKEISHEEITPIAATGYSTLLNLAHLITTPYRMVEMRDKIDILSYLLSYLEIR